ncbi:peptidylprolyl isomerase [Thiomicrorhabdus aquaedulcis]|uniref:peptidylprolyl isomerase n=1 Tax=Thiomicrorhabdus aquaedulcis TaxID=2211106 RepID=UPI000FD7070A|nr:peptidylprolyl isomerase [Thiomicrorhabdus aquaedulcis]
MNRRLFLNLQAALLTALLSPLGFAQAETKTSPTPSNPQVLIETNHGTIMLELYADKAPKTVENFLRYVNEGFYNGTIFHRVIADFMVQGGGFTEDMQQKIPHAPIQNEADNGLRNRIGTVAMARTNDPHSATAQFFINVAQNTFLDFREKTASAYGYTVFGQVTNGMKVVNKIRLEQTGFKNGFKDVPVNPVVILKVTQIK